MLRLTTNARTVWVGDLKTETKVGNDGKPYISKSILFRVASNRDYTINKVVNGVTVKERPSDFIFCKANGSVAQAIHDYASAKDTSGKTISRHLALHGSLETYTTKKAMQVNATINGQIQAIPFEVEVEQTIFIVRDLDFLDSSAKANLATPIVGTVATATGTTPVAQIQTQVVAQVQQTQVQQPVIQTQVEQTPVVQTIAETQVVQPTISTVVSQTTESLEIPEIPETNGSAVDGECPF